MKELSLIPLRQLNAALATLGVAPELGKPQAIARLRIAIERGDIDLAGIMAADTVVAPAPLPGADTSAFAGRITELERSVADSRLKLQSDVERVQGELVAEQIKIRDKIVASLETHRAKLEEMSGLVIAKAESLKDVDYDIVRREINNAVAEIVAPFKREAAPEVLERMAAAIPVTRAAVVKDVFAGQVLAYEVDGEKVDFSDMTITVWDDAQSPNLLEDYVFAPQWLHQSLISLERSVPINMWLAGERGTGKTEFVTQLAARLGRRLFRINFDEASERADFVGGNSIEDSSMVWKDGILAQAIRHPGALVLLDEIGFARAQSVAVLHSVCEPSPHRALSIQDTGEHIPVANYVAFFCADNSNGYGDNTGNFAGLRDQSTAFIDRFGYTFYFDYLSEKAESELLASRADITSKAALMIVKVATLARKKAKAGLLTQPPSLRQLLAWAIAAKAGIPASQAFRTAVVNKYPADCEAELLGVFTAGFDIKAFKHAMKGA